MLNDRQQAILLAGAAVAAIMVLFPPYFDIGGLFGGLRFAFVLHPPAWNYNIDFRPVIASQTLLLQLSAVACFTLAAVQAYDHRASRLRTAVFTCCALVDASFAMGFAAFSAVDSGRGWLAGPFLLCLIPIQFPGGYFLFWLRLAYLAFATLVGVSLIRRRSGEAVRNSVIVAVGTAAFLLLYVASAAAARR